MPSDSGLEQARQALRDKASSEDAAFLQGYFKCGPGEYGEGDQFLGVRVPQTRQIAKQFKTLPLPEILTLLHSPFHEERLLALLLMVHRYGKADQTGQEELFSLYVKNSRYINNWDLVDVSAPKLSGPHLLKRPRTILYDLADSTWLWDRRIAIMSSWAFLKVGELEDTLALCERLMGDPEDLMHKACGWMLRELGKRDQPRLERYLKQHLQVMPRTMLRYAIEKFPKELRQAYLQGTIP